MSPGTIAFAAIAIGIVVWVLFVANLTVLRRRRAARQTGATTRAQSAAAGPGPSSEPQPAMAASGGGEVTVERVPEKVLKPLTPSELAVTRRQFLNRAMTSSFLTFLGVFGMASLSFLWPKLTGGFGTVINAGNYDDLLSQVGPPANFKPKFVPEGRFWLVYYEGNGESPIYEITKATEVKMQALYRKCVHLGCSVPHCETSMLFECPCHGSKYKLTGEYHSGPAPRGLDRFPVIRDGDNVLVDTGDLQIGPPRGTDTWDRFSQQVGPLCVPV